jgi:hypothetical protein
MCFNRIMDYVKILLQQISDLSFSFEIQKRFPQNRIHIVGIFDFI